MKDVKDADELLPINMNDPQLKDYKLFLVNFFEMDTRPSSRGHGSEYFAISDLLDFASTTGEAVLEFMDNYVADKYNDDIGEDAVVEQMTHAFRNNMIFKLRSQSGKVYIFTCDYEVIRKDEIQ